MAIDKYALTNLANAITYLGLTAGEQDDYIVSIINRASDVIENALHNKIMARLNVKERHDGEGQKNIYFKQFPVLAVNLDELAWAALTKRVTRKDGGSFITDGFVAEENLLIQNSDLNSGLMLMAAVTATTMDFAMAHTIVNDTEDNNVIISHFRELWIDDIKVNGNDYEVHADHIYYPAGFPKGHGNVRMTYYGGYRTIPDDVERICLRIIKKIYEKSEGIKSEKLGPYSVTHADGVDSMGDEIRNELIKYANVVI
jgi:hypothetical protein